MPQNYIFETAVTVDHETGECRVDTTREGIASKLRRMKFREVTRDDSRPYRRFIGSAEQVTFRRPKSDRAGMGFGRKKTARNHGTPHVPEK